MAFAELAWTLTRRRSLPLCCPLSRTRSSASRQLIVGPEGWITDYLSRAMLVGYIHGVAVFLIIGQLEKLFGLDIEASAPIPQILEVW